jgi:hypothetical protein
MVFRNNFLGKSQTGEGMGVNTGRREGEWGGLSPRGRTVGLSL